MQAVSGVDCFICLTNCCGLDNLDVNYSLVKNFLRFCKSLGILDNSNLSSMQRISLRPSSVRLQRHTPLGVFAFVAMAAGLVVSARMMSELYLHCSEAISSDYIAFPAMIERIVANHFLNLKDFVYGSHVQVFPLLLTSVNAVVFGWSMRFEIFFGIALILLRLVFVWSVIGRKSLGTLGLLFLMQFSMQNLSVLDYPQSTGPAGLTTLGFCTGLWALLCIRGVHKRLLFSGLGAVVACLSAGTFIPCVFR